MVPLMVGMDAVHAEIFPEILLGKEFTSDVDEIRPGLPATRSIAQEYLSCHQ